MAYRSDVRITFTKKGYDRFKNIVKRECGSEEDNNLLNSLDVLFVNKNYVLIGWDDIRWSEYDDTCDTGIIMKSLWELEDEDISYHYARIGESYDDYDEQSYDSTEGQDYIPFPSLIRRFDDDEIKREMSANFNKINKNEKEVNV